MMQCRTLSLLTFIPLMMGCDAIVPVAQPVTIQLANRQASAAISGATVIVGRSSTTHPTTAETVDTHQVQQLDVGETDPNGLARIDINTTYIRGGLNGMLFDRQTKDRLTGTKYDLHIRHGEVTETLPVRLTPGNSATGKLFTVQVRSIGHPYELQTIPRPAN